ncbi:MAG TPA: polymer-forming cytoskeletal protein [Verrucomicrobiae bacterium]|nr:polymer-forming cytoskeletal protein [Verrucomicrobiae bacterium]
MNAPGNTSKNVLASDVEIKGNLKFSGELTFEGKLDGEVQTDGVLNLGDTAVINGNVSAQSVVVRGKMNGNITAKEKIEIKAKSELFGDIRASKLVIEEGVTYVGKTEVNPNKVSPSPSRAGEAPKIGEPARPPGR